MLSGQNLIDNVVSICGLPQIRGTTMLRRVLWELKLDPEQITLEQLETALPHIEKALRAFMAERVAKERADTLREFLQRYPNSVLPNPDPEQIATFFREATNKLNESRPLKSMADTTVTRRLRTVKDDEEPE